MTVHPLSETLDHVVSVVGETLEALQAEIHMIDAETTDPPRASWPAHAVPLGGEQIESLIRAAVSQGTPAIQQDDNAFLCASPITRDEETLAVIILSARGNEEHAEENARILSGICLAAALVIHEAQDGYDVGGWRDVLDEALSRVDNLVD